MSTPNPQNKTSRRNAWLAFSIIALPFFWFVPGAIYMRKITQEQNQSCQANLHTLGIALFSYAKSHDNHLPDAKSWIALVPLTTNGSLHCSIDLDKAHPSSYAMNANLSGKKLSDIKNPHDVILLYETTSKASTPFGRGEDLPRVGKDDVGVGRHHTIGYRFNYYLMADGTVRAPANMDEIKTYKWTP